MMLVVLQQILLEALLDIVYAPIWWYTRGVVFWLQKCISFLKTGNESLAPGLWLKNLFVPMFGQYDWQGRIISFLIRFVQVVARGFVLVIWGIGCVMLFLMWLLFPLMVGYEFLVVFVR